MNMLAADFSLKQIGHPVGAEITHLDLTRPVPDATFAAVEEAMDRYSVVVVRDQVLTPRQLAEFSRRFGNPQVNVRAEVTNSEAPEITLISNIVENGKPIGSRDAGRYWHSDLCYLENPSRLTLLNALEVPQQEGKVFGATRFSSVGDAYDALPDDMKHRLEGLKAANGYRFMWRKKVNEFGLRPALSDKELEKYPEDAIHPVIRTHPRTGRKCIYVCEGYTHRILGIPEEESQELLQFLFAHVTQEKFIYAHEWRLGDVLMWDNCAVQHKATSDYGSDLRRKMQRCCIEGSLPV